MSQNGVNVSSFGLSPLHRSDLIILSMTQTAFLLDHEEYVRYAARKAIHQYIYGSAPGRFPWPKLRHEVAAPAKATSYAPEVFDLAKPRAPEKASEDQAQRVFVARRGPPLMRRRSWSASSS